jgi:hypothetical protein
VAVLLEVSQEGFWLDEQTLPSLPLITEKVFFINVKTNLQASIGQAMPPEAKLEYVMGLLNDPKSRLSQERMEWARDRAYDWVWKFKSKKGAEIAALRAERAELTIKLRQELAPVVDYLQQRKAPEKSWLDSWLEYFQ